ncbi:carboxyltransferase domain-containing protein [Paenarthrobacter sp. NyZ202]|uniref:carboxyltransferase domain-containing protein n=1 Tax=Paenarthrobacter sp. NyZ202 TaxID=3402689 RepID=UPI003CF80D1C
MAGYAPTILSCRPGTLLVELPQPAGCGPWIAPFIEAVKSLDFDGITDIRGLRDGVIVDYVAGAVDLKGLSAVLVAAFSKVSYARGDFSAMTHSVPAIFDGPDLAVACLLLNVPERSLIRRLCRTKHKVRTFASPGASALLEVPWAGDWHQSAQGSRPAKLVPQGSLTLSRPGVTLTSRSSYSDELVVGRVGAGLLTSLPDLRMGDSLWLRRGSPLPY